MAHLINIRKMAVRDWPAVREIYLQGIASGIATFHNQPPVSYADWEKNKFQTGRLVIESDLVIGWCCLSSVSSACHYQGVAETSIYIDTRYQGMGHGDRLLSALVETAESNNIWMLEANMFAENIRSLALHKKHGFRVVGRREKLAYMTHGMHAGKWLDTFLLERRSKTLGGA